MFVTFETEEKGCVKWFRNGCQVENCDDFVIETKRGKSTLRIKNADKNKEGKYEVLIENDRGVIAKSASSVKLKKGSDVENIQPPAFIRPLRPRSVKLGENVLMETEVISSPNASFQWFIGTKEVTSYLKENKIHNIYITNRENISSLFIENISEQFAGILTCRAENFAGSVSSSASVILENYKQIMNGKPPHFIIPLHPITTVMDGEPIVLQCVVTGKPCPKIVWYRNGKVIQYEKDISIARQESGMCELCIKEAFPEMSGIYGCEAINEFGTCSCECLVNVEGSAVQ